MVLRIFKRVPKYTIFVLCVCDRAVFTLKTTNIMAFWPSVCPNKLQLSINFSETAYFAGSCNKMKQVDLLNSN